jgi:hypothetical protein
MNKTPYPLLTRKQVEDYLIYHCPLLRSTPADTDYWFTDQQMRDHPFMVEFELKHSTSFIRTFVSVQSSPWRAYNKLAEMVWRDINALPYITNLYYNS